MACSKFFTRREMLRQLGALAALGGAPACSWTAGGRPSCAGVPDGGPSGVGTGGLLSGIDAFVVVMMENRSFDHVLGALRHDPAYPGAAVVDGLSGGESNPDPQGRPVPVFRLNEFSYPTPPHDWDACRVQYDQGRNDGFVRAFAGPDQNTVMGYYARADLPVYYALADRFTVCDRWFSSVLGPTWPNRFYLHAATSAGIRGNTGIWFADPPTLWEALRERCCSCSNYGAGITTWYTGAFPGKSLGGNDAVDPGTIEDFFRDAQAGSLPRFSLIDPDFQLNDDRPPHDIRLGQAFVASIYRALALSPQWPRALLLIIYDEHGGFFDHVPPPTTVDPLPAFTQLGFRVPALVVGATVRQGHVDSTVREHVSVAATLAARFGIRSLGPRMDHAADLSSCIDPALAVHPAPPPELPRVVLSRGQLREQIGSTGHPDPQRVLGWLRRAADLEAVRLLD